MLCALFVCSYYGNFREQDIWFEQGIERKIPNPVKSTQTLSPELPCTAVEGHQACVGVEVSN